MAQASQENHLPLGSGNLGLATVIPNAEPGIAPLLRFFHAWTSFVMAKKPFLPDSGKSLSQIDQMFFSSLSHSGSMQFSTGSD